MGFEVIRARITATAARAALRGPWLLAASLGLIWLGAIAISAQEKPAGAPASASPDAPGEVPEPPQDPSAAKAYAVLDKHCARCHQAGKRKGALPAKPLANILSLAELAANPAMVRPGTPDASRLYTMLLGREFPHESAGEGSEEPSPDELRAVREWIQAVADPQIQACRGIVRVDAGAAQAAMLRAIEAAPEPSRPNLRFITLANLHNTCVGAPAMTAYRQGVSKLLNSVSWAPVPVRPTAVDTAGSILMLDLASIGWVAAHWDRLVAANPFAALTVAQTPAEVQQAIGTHHAILRGDWLAHAMTQPGLYAEMLGLPSRFSDLQRLLKVDVEAGLRAGTVARAGIRESRIVHGPRIVERHALTEGAGLWLSYDFTAASGRQNIVEHPIGPTQSVGGRTPFRHDAGRTLFHLPNGFIAFALHDARGDRLDLPPPAIERSAAATKVTGCLGCHRGGPIGVKDEVRALVEADRSTPRELRDAVLALYATDSELERHIRADATRYVSAQVAAGIDPALTLGGLEPIAKLAGEYEAAATADRIAAEAGVPVASLLQRAQALGGETRLLALKLRQGLIDRIDVNRLLVVLDADASKKPVPTLHQGLNARRGLDLVIWSEKERYEPGELVVFGAYASTDCHLTMVSVDAAGKATVLYPNEFEQNNLIAAGRELRLPAEGAPYQFRAKDKGRETLVAICAQTTKTPDGIQPDYERQRFTMLGNWGNFLTQAYAEEAGERRQPESKQIESKKSTKRKGRSRPEAKADGKPEPKRREVQARTAITYDVE